MFGFVTANWKELTKPQRQRYQSVYCGICHAIGENSSQTARLSLQYDMTFLAMLLMSLYEPEEQECANGCLLHPLSHRRRTDSRWIRYSADMNVALAYYKALDDWQDENSLAGKVMAQALEGSVKCIEEQYPRQCGAMRSCIEELSALEKDGCDNPDLPANCFGRLMAELFVVENDLWEPALRQMGMSLGRFIYLLDAAVDFEKDKRQGSYNPLLQAGDQADWNRWDAYLVLAMSRCTENYEKLPLVQDKDILDNILYSGVWTRFRGEKKEGNA